MLNLNEIQTLGRFAYDLVLAEDEENKIFAFEYEEDEDSLLLMVPNAFYHSVKNRCKAFVEMLCLCSQTITIPLAGNYYDEISSLLSTYCLNYRYKKGKNVIKFYLNSECWVSYLDFVTFQAIQFK
jgi:predicted aldo/keto reductase-like oxidoreductase